MKLKENAPAQYFEIDMTCLVSVLDIHVCLTFEIADTLLIVVITTWKLESMWRDDLEMPRKKAELGKSLTVL